jgi:hypothetical protein
MSAKKLLALWGLKWNPFTPELPGDALLVTARIESFAWRVEQQLVQEGGFALISGDPYQLFRATESRWAPTPSVILLQLSARRHGKPTPAVFQRYRNCRVVNFP